MRNIIYYMMTVDPERVLNIIIDTGFSTSTYSAYPRYKSTSDNPHCSTLHRAL